MINYQTFIFKSYNFDRSTKTLTLEYGYDDELSFTETYTFDFELADYDEAVMDKACQLLFFMAGVSYYKSYLAPSISVQAGVIGDSLAAFLNKTYQRGLGEFFYVNKLDPLFEILFPVNTNDQPAILKSNGTGCLVGLGGGKDSLVSVELLRNTQNISTWSLGHKAQLMPLVDRINLEHLWVERAWDHQLLELNSQGAYNGHIPISAILACAGIVTAVLSGKRDVVVSNEQSANEPTLEYKGVAINHQYSKSQDFESDFQQVLKENFGDSLRYYSLLRPLSELRISELFANHSFAIYRDVFSSCNKAFTHNSNEMSWCGKCPKCAFVFLALTPFVNREELESLWGKNLLLDPELEHTYKQLLGIEGDKPLDCVGEIQESRIAMQHAATMYPELATKYIYDLDANYDFRAVQSHVIPQDIYTLIESNI